jgi:hypothetical protein
MGSLDASHDWWYTSFQLLDLDWLVVDDLANLLVCWIFTFSTWDGSSWHLLYPYDLDTIFLVYYLRMIWWYTWRTDGVLGGSWLLVEVLVWVRSGEAGWLLLYLYTLGLWLWGWQHMACMCVWAAYRWPLSPCVGGGWCKAWLDPSLSLAWPFYYVLSSVQYYWLLHVNLTDQCQYDLIRHCLINMWLRDNFLRIVLTSPCQGWSTLNRYVGFLMILARLEGKTLLFCFL